MSMQSVKTEGASGPVYSKAFQVAAGLNQVLLAALPAANGVQDKYRVVGATVSVGASTAVYIYHGATTAAGKVLVGGLFTANTSPVPVLFGDWALNQGSANEPVCIDNPNGSAVVTMQYQLL